MEPEPRPLSWSRAYELRKAARARFGRHFDLPLERKAEQVAARFLRPGDAVLDVGAHRRQFASKLARYRADLRYRSLDPDADLPHDFRSLDEVEESFDGVCVFEVLEHLPLEGLAPFLGRLRAVLRPGGLLFATTPCVLRPGRFEEDATHRTPLAHDELAGRLEGAGFEVTNLYRLFHASWASRLAHVRLAGWLHRFLGVDYATSVMAVARRPGEAP